MPNHSRHALLAGALTALTLAAPGAISEEVSPPAGRDASD